VDADVERRVEILDLETLEWSEGPKLPGMRMNGFTPAVCVFDGDLLASPADGKLYRLTEDRASWDVVGEIEEARFVHRMVPIDGRTVALVGGDDLMAAISAAAILAKVARDAEMAELAVRYPGYGLEQHKGYATVRHLAALAQLGPTPLHRRSFAPVRGRPLPMDAGDE